MWNFYHFFFFLPINCLILIQSVCRRIPAALGFFSQRQLFYCHCILSKRCICNTTVAVVLGGLLVLHHCTEHYETSLSVIQHSAIESWMGETISVFTDLTFMWIYASCNTEQGGDFLCKIKIHNTTVYPRSAYVPASQSSHTHVSSRRILIFCLRLCLNSESAAHCFGNLS